MSRENGKKEKHMQYLSIQAEEAVELMLSGFSVSVYGCGSKISFLDGVGGILKQYIGGITSDYSVIRIKGYDQTFPLIRTLSANIIGLKATGRKSGIRNQADVLKAIEKIPTNHKIFILIDSIDAQPMRANQEFFSLLAEKESVHICASVDHSKVGLLWSPPQLKRFKWYWLEANTFEPYNSEVKDLLPTWQDMIEGKAEAASRSLAVVLASLTGSHREVVKLLAKMQLEKCDKSTSPDVHVQVRSTDLVRRCKSEMIADNQLKMRSLLQELIDHRLVLNAKDRDTGNEGFWLPFDRNRLESVAGGHEFN